LEVIRQILRGEKPMDKATLKPTGRYLVSAATFKGLLLAVKDTEQRVSARSNGEIPSRPERRNRDANASTPRHAKLIVEGSGTGKKFELKLRV
jgi:hypothetical protein